MHEMLDTSLIDENVLLANYSVDGTFSNGLGKFVNHSTKHSNCVAKPVTINEKMFIGLFAIADIVKGDELRYHYGISGEEWMKVFLSSLQCFQTFHTYNV